MIGSGCSGAMMDEDFGPWALDETRRHWQDGGDLGYLETQVQHREPSAFLGRLFPVVELDFQTPVSGRWSGRTVGTINPGFVWVGKRFQVGLEAAVPANERTGKNIGVRFLLRFSLDELIPRLQGPLFSNP
jgi:hypothetical protein